MTETETPRPARSTPFPDAPRRKKGYEKRAVDTFLEKARDAFEADEPGALRSTEVREASFPLVRGGYAIGPVDAALGRVEDAFAAREREYALSRLGARAWVAETRDTAQVVLDRLSRPRRARFERVGILNFGYAVDAGDPVTAEQVRSVAFRVERNGYREAQVDAVLDAVVEVMLAIG
jgi:DivIVA domain-containing protein